MEEIELNIGYTSVMTALNFAAQSISSDQIFAIADYFVLLPE